MNELNNINKASYKTAISLKVIGIGGAGNNAVNMMFDENLPNVDFIVANTDVQSLEKSKCTHKIALGKENRGFGAGSDPKLGAKAADESTSEIKEALKDSDVVILTAGFGGGTGTGATPKIAQLAKENGALTIGLVTTPFLYEGQNRMIVARNGIEELKRNVDAFIVLSNEKLSYENPDVPFAESLKLSNITLKNIIIAIHDILNRVGTINIDFADIKHTLKDSGLAIVGIGQASGENRAEKAVKKAFESNLYEHDIKSASKLLINIQHDKMVTNKDIKKAVSTVHEILSGSSENLISDCKIGQEIVELDNNTQFFKVSIIVSGVNANTNTSEIEEQKEIPTSKIDLISDLQPEVEDMEEEVEQKVIKEDLEQDNDALIHEATGKKYAETKELNSYFDIDDSSLKDEQEESSWFIYK
ncbi:cell division protein FtsZ [Mycoplasmopsis verecunda]|uniref:Cell division protein FtsZ n=1 Tax=Mycoplasmopsis verecunda TaxID=171291 RepID=A0A1T4MDJ5_9BACT|nr:cell division protein FtsZ [Mycoplasmopsis verecunda]WPB54825.1 cell division protein FtsZ [Mycoplasmopsis verecunda]SJZ64838.1 cell division protein FtsZ [Mycoplasmopsis verecunda]